MSSNSSLNNAIRSGNYYAYMLIKHMEIWTPDRFIKIDTEMTPRAIILCGIPTSGKSTWAKKNAPHSIIISRDNIREVLYGDYKNIPFTTKSELMITNIFDTMLQKTIEEKRNIVLDNTHAKEKYLKEIIKTMNDAGYFVQVKFFDIPLWKAYYRNWKRRLTTGKWIPVKVIKSMKESYDKINKTEYEKYSF